MQTMKAIVFSTVLAQAFLLGTTSASNLRQKTERNPNLEAQRRLLSCSGDERVECHKNGKKIFICHHDQDQETHETLCVNENGVEGHMENHEDRCGECPIAYKFCLVILSSGQNFENWEDYARTWECPNESSDGFCHLASIRNQEEFDQVADLLDERLAALGGQKDANVWTWNDGSSWDSSLRWVWQDNYGYGACGEFPPYEYTPANCLRMYGANNALPQAPGFEDDCCHNGKYVTAVIKVPEFAQPVGSEDWDCVPVDVA